MKVLNHIICISTMCAAIAGLVAIAFAGWEPPPPVVALAAFVALAFAASARGLQLLTSTHGENT